MSSLSDVFTLKVDPAKVRERDALFLGMGDGSALETAGLRARNNAADKLAIETDRKKRNQKAVERAIELIAGRLNKIEDEMIGLENKIADSREIIANNNADIEFIRSLDTDNLYGADGKLDEDVTAFLARHGYDDLDGKSEYDIRHMLTEIEINAIEQNEVEDKKINGWLERHEHLRGEADKVSGYSPSNDQRQRGTNIANRDPEQLARDRINALPVNDKIADANMEAESQVEQQVASTGFNFGGMG